jgi:uncharacterized membrane protein YcaP (DUF421 family)
MDWAHMFTPKFPVLETACRSAISFLILMLLARVFRRDFGKVGTSDVLAILLLASAVRNALAYDGSDPSMTTAFVSVMTLLLCAHVFNWLGTRMPIVRSLIYADRVVLLRNGEVHHRNLTKVNMTEGDLKAKLRGKGIADPRQVLAAYLEGDGTVSVIERPLK